MISRRSYTLSCVMYYFHVGDKVELDLDFARLKINTMSRKLCVYVIIRSGYIRRMSPGDIQILHFPAHFFIVAHKIDFFFGSGYSSNFFSYQLYFSYTIK